MKKLKLLKLNRYFEKGNGHSRFVILLNNVWLRTLCFEAIQKKRTLCFMKRTLCFESLFSLGTLKACFIRYFHFTNFDEIIVVGPVSFFETARMICHFS